MSWLSGAAARPAVPYLASVPILFPFIGLTQLVQYLVACHVANLTPGEFCSRLSGTTGDFQGIVSAVVIAASGNFEEFVDNSHKAIKWLFYSGLRGQQAFPVTSVEPSIVQDSIAGGEGTPSPMLSIAGLTLTELQPFRPYFFSCRCSRLSVRQQCFTPHPCTSGWTEVVVKYAGSLPM